MWLLALLVLSDSAMVRQVAVAPGESLRVTVVGEGRPVVLIPGLFGSAYGFRNVVPGLAARGFQVIVVEPLAVGSSSRPGRADYSMTAQAERVAAALDSLGVSGAIVAAHSLSCSIALRMAARHPGLVDGILLIDGGTLDVGRSPGFRRAMMLVPWVKMMGGMTTVRRAIRRTLTAASGNPSWVTDELISRYTEGAARDLDATLNAYLGMARGREPFSLEDRLSRITCPVRLLSGQATHPEQLSAREIDRLQSGLPSFSVELVVGAGHYIQEERPDVVIAAVLGMANSVVAKAAAPRRAL